MGRWVPADWATAAAFVLAGVIIGLVSTDWIAGVMPIIGGVCYLAFVWLLKLRSGGGTLPPYRPGAGTHRWNRWGEYEEPSE